MSLWPPTAWARPGRASRAASPAPRRRGCVRHASSRRGHRFESHELGRIVTRYRAGQGRAGHRCRAELQIDLAVDAKESLEREVLERPGAGRLTEHVTPLMVVE